MYIYIFLSYFQLLDYYFIHLWKIREKCSDMRKDIENIQSKLRIISTIFHSSYG